MVKVYLLMIHESGLDESYEPFQSTTCAGVFDSPGAAERAILANEVFNFKEISFMERGGSPRADHCWRWATEVGNTFGTSAFAGIEAHALQGMPGEDVQLEIGKSEVLENLGLGFVGITEPSIPDEDRPIKIGDVVCDSYGRDGIVIEEKRDPPDPGWVHAQDDSRVRELGTDERWLTVYPFTGGSVLSPLSLTKRLRPLNIEDLRTAYRAGNGFAKDKLKELFPERIEQVLEIEEQCVVGKDEVH